MKSPLLTREAMLLEMGIQPLWRLKSATVSCSAQGAIEAECDYPATNGHSEQLQIESQPCSDEETDWHNLSVAVSDCKACVLCERRNKAVLGVGDIHPEWLFIGEGPGAEEDARGEPFVGQAGRLLDNMLLALGLKRGSGVYIANAVKCRPPGNRTPEATEMSACFPFLEKQIALLKPKIIVLLGRAAVHSVLKEDNALSRMRQQRFSYAGIPVVVTYHPAYLLRNLVDKAKAWEDLLFAQRCLRG